jgi:radical SAM superfamily enzyme YgiQ (UPF0313 family)
MNDGRPAVVGLRADSTSLAVDDVQVSSWDLAGRPYVFVRDGWTYRRALDGRVLQKGEGAARVRRVLAADAARPVIEAARADSRAALSALEATAAPRHEEARRRLARIVSMDGDALGADAERFRRVYRPVGMLPPDQYLAVVLQATEGCAWNECTFCGLYRDTPFRARRVSEFAAHVHAVLDYFGDAITLRRTVFLGEANAMCVGHDRLIRLLDVVDQAFARVPGRRLRGVHAFVDVWTGARRTAAQYRQYAARGLRRLYVGLESGDRGLLGWLRKPFAPAEAIELVATVKSAGLGVGVIVLLGAGGERFHDAHVRETATVLTRMGLDAGDLLYFSELVPSWMRGGPSASYDLRPLSPAGCAEQRRLILAGARPADPARPPRIASYDVREFVY